MSKQNVILELYKIPQTIFTLKDVSLVFPDITYTSLKRRMYYYAQKGMLKKIRKGIYAKENYDPLELANKLYTPSYISLETVLQKEGVIFQYYETIFVSSYLTRDIAVAKHSFSYHKLPAYILLNKQGIEQRIGFSIATKERAFLDAIYNYKEYHFDNMIGLNWDTIMEIKSIYQNKMLEKRVEEYYQLYKEQDV
ncbi:MAG: hypothetical protein COY81_00795 [Candidatus Pacebacteria bacterium CG_4_10_14_0_8_um_filter_43_12]|nr:MAG: hypothetical protein COY81_00795 [Candidatus Pacebacteria bacterium CG_4_10_14_0_8_um_filter_43_12]